MWGLHHPACRGVRCSYEKPHPTKWQNGWVTEDPLWCEFATFSLASAVIEAGVKKQYMHHAGSLLSKMNIKNECGKTLWCASHKTWVSSSLTQSIMTSTLHEHLVFITDSSYAMQGLLDDHRKELDITLLWWYHCFWKPSRPQVVYVLGFIL